MDSIDVHDLSEEEAHVLAAFVEFLRHRKHEQSIQEAQAQERDWIAGSVTAFARDWNNNEDAIYDNWKEHYHVPER